MKELQLKIDSFGRVLIPQEIRGNLGLVSGSTLSLKEEGGKITLSPVPVEEHSLFKKKNQVLIYTGKLEGKKVFEDWESKIQEDLNKKHWGL